MKNRMASNKWKQHLQRSKIKPKVPCVIADVCLEAVLHTSHDVKSKRVYSDSIDPGELNSELSEDCCRKRTFASVA